MSVKGSITRADYLPYDELKRLIKCLEDDKQYMWAAYCLLSFCMSIRVSDILALKWNDILGIRDFVVTEKKTGKTKSVPIGASVRQHIFDLYEKMGQPPVDKLIFYSDYTGKPYTKMTIGRKCSEWKEKYNLKIGRFSSHSFRKAFGRWYYQNYGANEHALIKLGMIFNHSSITTTAIYIGLTHDEIYDAFNDIGL